MPTIDEMSGAAGAELARLAPEGSRVERRVIIQDGRGGCYRAIRGTVRAHDPHSPGRVLVEWDDTDVFRETFRDRRRWENFRVPKSWGDTDMAVTAVPA